MLRERGLTLATMESCTGGLLASTITDVDGASDYFLGGYVSYATEMKVALGVDAALIEQHGVISSEVACDMARAARENLGADYGIGVTGITGAEPVEGKPPGTLHVAVHDGDARRAALVHDQPRPRRQQAPRRHHRAVLAAALAFGARWLTV